MMQHARRDSDVRPAVVGFRLEVVRQLLGDLDTVTAPGRAFTMGKVVGLLRDELIVIEPSLTELQRRIVRRALDELIREKARQLPDADIFVARTQMITDTLALV